MLLIKVALNPAYQAPEIAYCLKKVGIKAIYAAESYKTQKYYEMLKEIIPEIGTNKTGKIKSKEYDQLSVIIVDSKEQLP